MDEDRKHFKIEPSSDEEQLSQSEIIDAIAALSQAIKANQSFRLGDDEVVEMANEKLKKLIPLIKTP